MMGAGYSDIAKCRICGSTQFGDIIDFGLQALASRFPRVGEPDPLTAPLVLVECIECGLVQLRHSVDSKELYTYTYGYQSGINSSMQNHLGGIACWIQKQCNLKSGDIVLDIGCNDGTLLKSYSIGGLQRYGIDVIAGKFKEQYPADIAVRESAFSTEAFHALCGDEKAKVITSIAMFYDLESPGDFVSGIKKTLSPEGVWVLEQSYLPSMLETNSYDTVCHEHLEYYSLRQIEWLANDHGLRVFDVERNATNGGSFRLAVCHENGPYESNKEHLQALREIERNMKLGTRYPFESFKLRVDKLRDDLVNFIDRERSAGKTFYLYGASTKGNTLLQYCGLDASKIVAAAERNPEKWGCRTPGTKIPIISEEKARTAKPDYFLVMPWHFRDEFVQREDEFRKAGGKLVFPLPTLEVV